MEETDPSDLAAGTNSEKGKGSADLRGGLSARESDGVVGEAPTTTGQRTEDSTKDIAQTVPASEWQAVLDPNTGMTYYHNTKTGVTQWTNPASQPAPTRKVSPELLLHKVGWFDLVLISRLGLNLNTVRTFGLCTSIRNEQSSAPVPSS